MVAQTNLNAEKFFKKTVELGLSMDQDLALAKLQLAGIAASRRKKIEAEKLLKEAAKLDKHNMLKDQIVMLKQQLKKYKLVLTTNTQYACFILEQAFL